MNSTLPSWNLGDLYASPQDPQIDSDLAQAKSDAQEFRAAYKNRLVELNDQELLAAIKEEERILERASKPVIYAHLRHAADTSDSERGALMSRLEEEFTSIRQELTFFALEWNALPEEEADKLLASEFLHPYRYHLRMLRRFKPYEMSEPEENLLQTFSLVGDGAWSRLFDEVMGRAQFQVGDRTLSEEETLALLYSPERDTRRQAAEGMTEGLMQQRHLLTYVFNVLVQDHALEDRVRGLPHPKKARNLANEIDDDSVESLLATTEQRSDLVRRYYHLKRELLRLDELKDYDRYAPLPSGARDENWTWQQAREFVTESYRQFSPRFGEIVQEFFEGGWIDADLRPGKRGGAFSASTVTGLHPYILVNFTGNSRDVSTLAHELGHGIHQYLSRQVGFLQADTPLTTAETASVFGEMLTFDRLLAQASDDRRRLSLLVSKIDEIIATVFRQVYMTRFEEALHGARRQEGELTGDRIDALWHDCNAAMFGDSVKLGDHYRCWWMYIPHFVHTPFYCYAYAFGLLLSLTLYDRYKHGGDLDFADKYTRILSLGGSVEPVELVGIAGIDLRDPGFWNRGFDLVESLIAQAESLRGVHP